MKLRYQMRGLGIGIIVTALLMGVALEDRQPLTDAEIRILATELGMVESDSLKLTDVQPNKPTEAPTMAPTVQPTAVPTRAPTTEPTAEPTIEPTIEPTVEPTSTPEVDATQAPQEKTAYIVVHPGASSYTVSKTLETAGLVKNAGAFDKYLCSNGYAERIQVGTFEIVVGTDEEEIAKIITKTE